MKLLNKKTAHAVIDEVADVAHKVEAQVPHKVPNKFKTAITAKTGRQMLKLQKHSPTLLFASGVVGVVGTVVLACRATLKVEEVLDNFETDRDTLKNTAENHADRYSENDYRKDQVLLYTQYAVRMTKLYAPALVCGALSITALTKSHNILSSRNASLTAAYVALDQSFTSYRGRVVEEVGEEKERDIRLAAETTTVTVDGPNGPKNVKEKAFGDIEHGPYAKIFGELNQNWSNVPEYNYLFLRGQQRFANDRLQSRGHLFLNEVYEALGLEHTKHGAVTGWLKGVGDGCVDFGIFTEADSLRVHELVSRGGEILLDFNVVGLIYDKI